MAPPPLLLAPLQDALHDLYGEPVEAGAPPLQLPAGVLSRPVAAAAAGGGPPHAFACDAVHLTAAALKRLNAVQGDLLRVARVGGVWRVARAAALPAALPPASGEPPEWAQPGAPAAWLPPTLAHNLGLPYAAQPALAGARHHRRRPLSPSPCRRWPPALHRAARRSPP